MKPVITLLLASIVILVSHTQVSACDLDPTAVLGISPNDVVFNEGYTVAFLGYFSMSNCGYLTDYRWQIDGVTEQAGGSFFTHSFTLPSGVESQNFDIQLRVRNSVNNYDYETVTITIVREHSSYYYLTDHLGSVRVTVNDAGNAVGWDDYYPFGLQMPGRTQNASNPNEDIKFTGYELEQQCETDSSGDCINDVTLGLYHAEARMYDPVLGRFMQMDPLYNEFTSFNPYQYTFNNPINFYDQNGLYPISIITRSYAPFKSFGPIGSRYHGDNRGHRLSRNASYRTSATIDYDTETRQSSVRGGRSYSRRVGASDGTYSFTDVDNRSRGNNLDVHSYGNNADLPISWDIDQFTKVSATIDGDIESDHILNISGTISGDDFPNQESIIYDNEGNSLWLGNFSTTVNKAIGPLLNLARENEGDVNINVNINIKVNADGVFQGVMLGDELISIEEWNKNF